jgi:uncharacterized iron-regulated membrane protein
VSEEAAPAGPALPDEAVTPDEPVPAGTRSSRVWRSLWRTHFYAGFFAAPILVMLALTGLVILYTQPIQDAAQSGLRTVTPAGRAITLDEQRDAVADAYPGAEISGVTPPVDREHATWFAVTTESGEARTVFVDPYRGTVLGSVQDGSDVVGLANRLHGNLNNESLTVPMPSLGGILGEGPAFADAAVGDVVIEVFAGWAMVLALTGIYLWLPRKKGAGKALVKPRWGRGGRVRWRDLHAIGGTLLGGLMIFFLATGLPWSAVWGSGWAYAASEITPNEAPSFWEWEGPASGIPAAGDVDRAGNAIAWAVQGDAVPTSGGGGHEGHGGASEAPAATTGPPAEQASLDLIAAASAEEGMAPGSTIWMPVDAEADDGTTAYGAYVVFNPWPGRMSTQGALYLDQFSGETLAKSTPETWGRLQWATEFGVQTHMGTQFGIVSRVLATAMCLLVFWNVFTAFKMWNRRRRRHTVGIPRRPVDVRMQRSVGIAALVLAVIYPLWGATLVVVLLFDRFVVRRVPSLRAAFGMR